MSASTPSTTSTQDGESENEVPRFTIGQMLRHEDNRMVVRKLVVFTVLLAVTPIIAFYATHDHFIPSYFPEISPASRTNYAGVASVIMVNIVTMSYVYLALIERDDPTYTQPDPYLGPNPPVYPDNRDPIQAAVEDEEKLIAAEKAKEKAKSSEKPASGDDDQESESSSQNKEKEGKKASPGESKDSKTSVGDKEKDSAKEPAMSGKGVGDLSDGGSSKAADADGDNSKSEANTLRSRKRNKTGDE